MLNHVFFNVVTNGSGGATLTSKDPVFGFLESVEWNNIDFAAGVDAVLSVTGNALGLDKTLLTLTDANADEEYFVTEVQHDNAGAAQTTRTRPIINGYLKLVVSSGGDTKTGKVVVNWSPE